MQRKKCQKGSVIWETSILQDLYKYYPEGNMPAEIIGTDEELPTQTPMNMIRYAPVSTTRTAIPRISTRSIF